MLRLIVVFAFALVINMATTEEHDEELLNRARPPKEAEELQDLLVVSIQNIVSLNDLVTQLTNKIVQVMLSVAERKTEIEVLKKSHSEAITELRNKIDNVETEQNSTLTALADDVRAVTEHFTSTDAAIEGVKEDLSLISREVTIVSAEDGVKDQRCAKVCAGTTGKKTTNWVNFSSTGIYTNVDMSGCGFVSIPTITTSLDGTTAHWDTTGSSEIYSSTATSFRIYIKTPSADRRGRANEYSWNIEWVAVGFTC